MLPGRAGRAGLRELGGRAAGRVRARAASHPAQNSSPPTASSASTGTLQPPVAACRKPTASGPAAAIREPTAWANPDSETAVTGSGARATVKKIARASPAPCPQPSSRGQAAAPPTGANSGRAARSGGEGGRVGGGSPRSAPGRGRPGGGGGGIGGSRAGAGGGAGGPQGRGVGGPGQPAPPCPPPAARNTGTAISDPT